MEQYRSPLQNLVSLRNAYNLCENGELATKPYQIPIRRGAMSHSQPNCTHCSRNQVLQRAPREQNFSSDVLGQFRPFILIALGAAAVNMFSCTKAEPEQGESQMEQAADDLFRAVGAISAEALKAAQEVVILKPVLDTLQQFELDTAVLCKEKGYPNVDTCLNCAINADEIPEYLKCATFALFDPQHPQSVTGEEVTEEELDVYNARQGKGKKGILELAGEIKKNIGKVIIWRLDPESALAHIAVGKFLAGRVDSACKAAGMETDECLLFHIVLFENSGGLWRKSGSGALGPAQIMPQWFKWQRNLSDRKSTKNFFKTDGKFDGRFDPIANVEMGARILKHSIGIFGKNHPDFAILAYNQGDPKAQRFANAWALKHKSLSFQQFVKQWKKKNPGQKFSYAYFLDEIGIPLAVMLRDEELVKQFMPSDNGGSGYLSKVLAMQEIAVDPAKFGLKKGPAQSLPIEMDAEGNVEHNWDNLFAEMDLSRNMSLAQFCKIYHFDLSELFFINKHIRNPYVGFDRDVRLWVPKQNAPAALRAKMTRSGAKLLVEFKKTKPKTIHCAKPSKCHLPLACKPVLKGKNPPRKCYVPKKCKAFIKCLRSRHRG